MTDDMLIRIYDLSMLLVGAFIGAWFYHRGKSNLPPFPEIKLPTIKGTKPPEKTNDYPRIGA